jgi:hypothetical protein
MRRRSPALRHAVRLVSAAALTLVLTRCGPPPEVCTANCPNVAGFFTVDTSQASGQCDFMPLIITGSVTIQQSADTTSVAASVRDTVSQDQIPLSGEVYRPGERDPADTVGSFSMLGQFVRPAFEDDPRLVTLRLVLSGSVSEDGDQRVLNGSLTTTDITPGTVGSCSVTITFSATDRSVGSGGESATEE